jgi:hypothetical protein
VYSSSLLLITVGVVVAVETPALGAIVVVVVEVVVVVVVVVVVLVVPFLNRKWISSQKNVCQYVACSTEVYGSDRRGRFQTSGGVE